VIASYDDTKPDGSHPAIMGFILADHMRNVGHLAEEERKKLVCEQYASFFQSPEALEPSAYVEKNWSAEEFSRGCYVAFMPPLAMTHFSHVLRKPLGPLHFAGTETATQWAGYMDGAIQAGEREAHLVLSRLASLSLVPPPPPLPLWEEEDPEVKAVPLHQGSLEKLLPSVKDLVNGLLAFGAVAAVLVASFLASR